MAEKNNANIGFEKQIWDAACVLVPFEDLVEISGESIVESDTYLGLLRNK